MCFAHHDSVFSDTLRFKIDPGYAAFLVWRIRGTAHDLKEQFSYCLAKPDLGLNLPHVWVEANSTEAALRQGRQIIEDSSHVTKPRSLRSSHLRPVDCQAG
jgi:hypothetical protein